VHGYRRLLSRRFPYGVYYQVDHDEVQIYRVLDCRQDPSKIAKKLRRGRTRGPES
jgi:plasmid stabilization system protein ParE